MAIKKHVFEKQEVAMTDLIEALDHNFGYPDMTGKVTRMFGGGQTGGTYAKEPSEDMDKRQIYEIVKRLLSANGEMCAKSGSSWKTIRIQGIRMNGTGRSGKSWSRQLGSAMTMTK